MAGRGKKVTDAHIELHADDSKLIPEVKVKAARVGREFGGQLNRSLRQLKIDSIDIKADPKVALLAINKTEARLRELSRSAETVEIKVRTENALRQLGAFRKKLGDVATDAGPDAATGFAAQFAGRIGPLMANVPISAPLIAAVAGAGAVMAPVIGSAVAAGIIGGAGLGGVAGGLKLAAKDARVDAAAKLLSSRIQDRLVGSAGVFVQPALAGLREIQKAADTVDIEEIFRDSARFVPVLTRGVTSAVTDLGDGFEALTGKADPVIAALSRSVSSFGQQFGESFKLLAGDADAGASAIDDLTLAMTNAVQATFAIVHGLAYFKSQLDTLDLGIDNARHGIEDFFTSMSGGRAEFDITADGMTNVERKAKDQADAEKKLADQQQALADKIKVVVDAEAIRKRGLEAQSVAQAAVTQAQALYSGTLDSFIAKGTRAAQISDGLRQASQNLFGSRIAETEATEAYQSAIDGLSESVKANKGTLDANTSSGRANRDSLQALLTSNNELYFANIEQGRSTDDARKLHEKRTEAVRKEARQLGLNKKETDVLIRTYGKIPGEKQTDLVVAGIDRIIIALKGLYVAQRALAEGKTVEQIRRQGTMGAFSALAYGGEVPGHSPHSRADNIPATVDGVPGVRLTAKEWVHPVDAVQYYGKDVMSKIQNRQIPRESLRDMYAGGGQIAPVDESRSWPFKVDVSKTYIIPREKALSLVAMAPGAFGKWPSSPGAQRGDSGVWRKIVALIRSTGPLSGAFGNGYRPGDPRWHGSGRAVDWMGYNQDRLAQFLIAKRPLEFIHRTRTRDYAYTRGVNKGSFNNALMEAHRNHIHAAFGEGGPVRPIAKVGRADTGRTTLEQGWNLIQNSTGKQEHMAVGMEEAVGVLLRVLGAIERLAPAMGEEVGRRVGGSGRTDVALGARAELFARTA